MKSKTVKARIPGYVHPRNKWRRLIHEAILGACNDKSVCYSKSDKLSLDIVLYLDAKDIDIHDIDNRLKDIMDALQGRAGGSKAKKTLKQIIPNDRQVYRVTLEKKVPPKQSHGLGHLTIKNLTGSQVYNV